jgi:hypothetical protein
MKKSEIIKKHFGEGKACELHNIGQAMQEYSDLNVRNAIYKYLSQGCPNRKGLTWVDWVDNYLKNEKQ